MYTLTLTSSERDAIDWVGYRYPTGDNLRKILVDCLKPDEEWDQDDDIMFEIPEHRAWEINDLAEENDGAWPGFSGELAKKMQAFVDGII